MTHDRDMEAGRTRGSVVGSDRRRWQGIATIGLLLVGQASASRFSGRLGVPLQSTQGVDGTTTVTVDAGGVGPLPRFFQASGFKPSADLLTEQGRLNMLMAAGSGYRLMRVHCMLDLINVGGTVADPVFNFTTMDAAFDALLAAGLTPVVNLDGNPTGVLHLLFQSHDFLHDQKVLKWRDMVSHSVAGFFLSLPLARARARSLSVTQSPSLSLSLSNPQPPLPISCYASLSLSFSLFLFLFLFPFPVLSLSLCLCAAPLRFLLSHPQIAALGKHLIVRHGAAAASTFWFEHWNGQSMTACGFHVSPGEAINGACHLQTVILQSRWSSTNSAPTARPHRPSVQ